MSLPKIYNVGTASVASDSTSVVGSGTNWLGLVKPDDVFRKAGLSVRIASVEGSGALTLAEPWPGDTLTNAGYEIAITYDGPEFQLRMRQVAEMVTELTAQGVRFDAFGEFSARVTYDDRPAGYVYLSVDGDGDTNTTWTLYIKLSSDTADWDDGQIVRGPQGLPGASGEPLVANVIATAGIAVGQYVMAPWVHAAATLERLKASIRAGTDDVQMAILVNGQARLGPYVVEAGTVLSEAITLPLVQDDEVAVAVLTTGGGDVKWLVVQMDAGS